MNNILIRNRLQIEFTTQVTIYMLILIHGEFSLNKRNFGLNGKERGSLIEVFCIFNYTSCIWYVC